MFTKSLAVALIMTALCAPIATAQTPIERLAPENAVLVVGSRNFQTLADHFKATPLWTLWNDPSMVKLRADAMKQFDEEMTKMFEDLGVEKDSMVAPTGAVGFAVFTAPDDMGVPKPAFLATADYGSPENVEKIDALIQAALARGEKEGDLEFEHKDVDGRKLYTVDFSKMQAKAQAAEADEDMEDMDDMPMPQPSEMMKNMTKVHFVRDGNVMMFATDMNAMSDAMELNQGKGQPGGRAADRPEFQAAMSKLGEADFYGVLLTRDILEIAGDEMGMAQMMRPSLRALVGEVQSYGLGVRFDGPTAMMEQTVTAYMPNGKQGLTTLMDAPAVQGTLPSFVGPESISYSNVSFRFSGLMDVIRNVIASNPMLAAQAGQEVDAMAPMVNQITASLGTQVHWSTSVSKPYTADSRHSLFAIECVKPQEFEQVIAGMAEGIGLESRDFLGQRIYTMPADMMAMPMPGMEMGPVSLGIGGGFIMLGSTPAVEQGLRATGQPGGATLASASDFQRAVAALPKNNVVAWGFSDTVASVESAIAMQREMMRNMIEQMGEHAGEMEPDEAADFKAMQDEMEAQMRESMKIWEDIDFNVIRRYLGPTSWQVQSTDDGFTFRGYALSATPGAQP